MVLLRNPSIKPLPEELAESRGTGITFAFKISSEKFYANKNTFIPFFFKKMESPISPLVNTSRKEKYSGMLFFLNENRGRYQISKTGNLPRVYLQ